VSTRTESLQKTLSARTITSERSRLLVGLGGLLVVVFLFSLLIGRYPQPGLLSFEQLAEDDLARSLLLNLRLPRVLSAALLGMSLAAAGAVFQMIFGNPLVEPGFLGVSQGAAFGAAASIIFISNSAVAIQVSATVCAFIGLGLSYGVARQVRFGGWVLRLLLAGIAVSALFSAGLGLLKYLADPLSQLPEITYWLLGGLWGITWERLASVLLLVLVGLLVIYRMRWRLNLLSLGDETAHSLGISPAQERVLVLTAATAATAAVISIAGIVGWIGLIVPHIARRLFGADARFSLPGALLIGGAFTMLCDDLARTLLPGEIPLGIITSLLGAVLFMGLMMTQKVRVRQ
jgi:iron complex transport system permease protein